MADFVLMSNSADGPAFPIVTLRKDYCAENGYLVLRPPECPHHYPFLRLRSINSHFPHHAVVTELFALDERANGYAIELVVCPYYGVDLYVFTCFPSRTLLRKKLIRGTAPEDYFAF